MMGRTHAVCGIATALTITQPDTVPEIMGAITFGALGGLICDIDIFSKTHHLNKVTKAIAITAITVIILAIVDALLNTGLFNLFVNHLGFRQVFGFIAFFGICVVCMITEHRTFSHSILALVLESFCLALISPTITGYFAIGFISHIILDLLNKKPVRIFFPSKKGICFRLCYANGVVNKILLVVGCIISVVMTIICFNKLL